MNGISLVFVITAGIAIVFLPRRQVLIPFLVGACYLTYGQGLDIGPFTFYVVRILLLAGFIRLLFRGEGILGGLNSLDTVMIAWACLAVISSIGHEQPASALVLRLGAVYDYAGIYFLSRALIRNADDFKLILKSVAILLVPVAIEMLQEKVTGRNLFSIFGGVSEVSQIREGKIRAQGPFMHPILAGTVGAVCLPLMVGLWRHYRSYARIGVVASCLMVWTSGSSGPMMSAIFAVGALFFWRYRIYLPLVRWGAFAFYILLEIVMKVPAYYLLARLDLAGGSTGYHRAQLINSAITHLNEWWLTGTDYTRHWMATGVTWNPNHTDITNQYIQMGVLGGMPLMLAFIALFILAFVYVGRAMRENQGPKENSRFLVWAVGASLFAHAATGISVAYFDQSFLFLYLTFGLIGSLTTWVEGDEFDSEEVSNSYHTIVSRRSEHLDFAGSSPVIA